MKRSLEKELMDLPGQPKLILEEDLRNLRAINRYLGGYRGVIRGLARLVREQQLRAFSLIDVGTGSGDIPARIAQWAHHGGMKANIVALERDPVTSRVAATRTQQTNPPFIPLLQRGTQGNFRGRMISVVRGDAILLPFARSSFDFVLASQLLHHFSEEEIVAMLRSWAGVARRAIIISDLIRHPLAYHGIRLLTRLFTRNAMTLSDAPLSVKRAFTLKEWSELFSRAAIGAVRIAPVFPFRMLALISLKGSSGISVG